MMQIPSVDWPRRTNPLNGSEDLLKQNPVTDAFPQEERVPVSLISNFTISNLSFTNVGSGIGTFDFKNGSSIDMRSFAAGSNKVSVGLSNKTLLLDVNVNNIASALTITSLSGVTAPTTSNQFLMWDGGGYVFTSSPFSFNVTANNPPSSLNISNGSTLSIISSTPIVSTIASSSVVLSFNGGLNVLNDVVLTGSTPNGYVLGYNSSTGKWGAVAPSAGASYSFNLKADAVDTFNVANLSTVSLLGNGGTISTAITGVNEISVDWTANLSDLQNVSTQTPLHSQALVYNSGTSKWEPNTISGGAGIFSNGLTAIGSNIKWGGTLTETTTIDGDFHNYGVIFNGLSKFFVRTTRLDQLSNEHQFDFGSNLSDGVYAGQTFMQAFDLNANTRQLFWMDSGDGITNINSINDGTNKRFKVETTLTNAGVYFLDSNVVQCGFKVEEDKIVVVDGVNTPSAGHVLTYMADGSSQFQPISGSGGSTNYTFSNGLFLNSSNVKLGGFLNSNTVIDGSGNTYGFILNDLSSYRHDTKNGDYVTSFSNNQIAGYVVIDGSNQTTNNYHALKVVPQLESTSLSSTKSNLTDEFVVRTTLHDAAIFYQDSYIIKSGFFAEQNKIVVMDGVNETPAIGTVLSYVSGGTVEYKPVTALLTGGTDGEYLGVVGSSVTWVAPKERVNICEFDSNANITIRSGLKFFTVPTEMDGWTLTDYTASVFVVGSGISTRVEIMVNGVVVSGSALTLGGKFDSKTGLTTVVNEGDTISLNILNTKPTPDQGLSVTMTLTKL